VSTPKTRKQGKEYSNPNNWWRDSFCLVAEMPAKIQNLIIIKWPLEQLLCMELRCNMDASHRRGRGCTDTLSGIKML